MRRAWLMRRCASSPASQSRYTVAVLTPSSSATWRTESSAWREPPAEKCFELKHWTQFGPSCGKNGAKPCRRSEPTCFEISSDCEDLKQVGSDLRHGLAPFFPQL